MNKISGISQHITTSCNYGESSALVINDNETYIYMKFWKFNLTDDFFCGGNSL